MRYPILAILTFLGFVGASSALASDKLMGKEIENRIVGNTVQLITQNLELAVGLVEKGGEFRGRIGEAKIVGTWSIKDKELLCFDLPDLTFDICRRVFDKGKFLELFIVSGDPGGRMEVLKGNPYNF